MDYRIHNGETIYVRAHAKINLALDITGVRDDGYHFIDTIMQTIGIYDEIFLKKIHKNANYIKVVSNSPRLPNDERNLVYKAIAAIQNEFHPKAGVFAEMTKKIPVAAGLGGGSADCAATLLALRKLFKLDVSNDELCKIGVKLGADVPFFIKGGVARARGIGEKLTPFSYANKFHTVIIHPPFSVSTADVFSKLNLSALSDDEHPNIPRLIESLKAGDTVEIAKDMKNVLESVTIKKLPIIAELKQFLIAEGAFVSLMSGSGSSVFGLFLYKKDALSAVRAVRKAYPHNYGVFWKT